MAEKNSPAHRDADGLIEGSEEWARRRAEEDKLENDAARNHEKPDGSQHPQDANRDKGKEHPKG